MRAPQLPPNTAARSGQGGRDAQGAIRGLVDGGLLAALEFHDQSGELREKSRAVKARIVEVARQAFLTQSYNSVSTHAVAQQAGVQQSIIRYHFGSKLGLWQACMDDLFERFRKDLAQRIADDADLDQPAFFASLIRHVILWQMTNFSGLRHSLNQINHENREIHEWLVKRHIKPIFSVLSALFDLGKANGILRPVPTLNLYYVLFLSASIFSLHHEIDILTGADITDTALAQEHVDTMIDLLMVRPS